MNDTPGHERPLYKKGCGDKKGIKSAGAAYAVCTSIYKTIFDNLCHITSAFGEDHPLSRALLDAQKELVESIDSAKEAIWLRLAHRSQGSQDSESRPDRTQDDG